MKKKDYIALLFCVFIGTSISSLPHIVSYFKTGSPIWIENRDNLGAYMPTVSDAYYNHLFQLSDPIFKKKGENYVPLLQFTPFIILAKLTGKGPLTVPIYWRIFAGISSAIALFLLLNFFLKSSFLSSIFTSILLCDTGLTYGKIISRHFFDFFNAFQKAQSSTLVDGNFEKLYHWKIITPSLTIAFFLLFILYTNKYLQNSLKKDLVKASASFGLLFYLLFYFWTAAGMTLLLGILLLAEYRKKLFLVGCLGTLIGLPYLITSMLFKNNTSDDWLFRNDIFLPIHNFSELILPKATIVLLIVCGFFVWKKFRELRFLYITALSGFVLMNNQIFTGFQIQNYHYNAVLGTSLSVLLVTVLVRCFHSHSRIIAVSSLLLVLPSGFWIRYINSTKNEDSIKLMQTYKQYKEEKKFYKSNFIQPKSVIAGDEFFVEFSMVIDNSSALYHYAVSNSPLIDDTELYERIALHKILAGKSRQEFKDIFSKQIQKAAWGPWARDDKQKILKLEKMLTAFDACLLDINKQLKKYKVDYLVQRNDQTVHPLIQQKWTKINHGKYWQIWQNPRKNNLIN